MIRWICLFLFSWSLTLSAQDNEEVIEKILRAIENCETLEYTLVMEQRIGKEMKKSRNYSRMSVDGPKVYIRQAFPNKGVEVLYHKALLGEKALVNPGGFPYINLWFNPHSSQMRKDNHHTLLYSGFRFLGKVIKALKEKAEGNFNEYFNNITKINWKGREMWKVEMQNPDYHFFEYSPRANEKISDMGARFVVSDHKIKEINQLYSFGESGKNVIKIPSSYFKKAILYVDAESYLPVYQEIYDDIGLYEQFEFQNLKVNPKFPSSEFTKNGPDYNF